jgi:PAS domain S-box-containing protein
MWKANQDLEQRVAARTHELRRANRNLRREIDERQQAVEAMQASEEKMRAILRASPVGIGLVIDRKLDWANQALFRMVGYDAEQLIGRPTDFLYSDAGEYERVGRKLYHNLSSATIGQVETRLTRGDGKTIDCTIRAFPLDVDNPVKGQIVTVSDTSEAKRLEAELQRARKMEAIGTLAGGVAHDLNNILSGIVSYPELILLDLPGDSPLREPIKTMKASGERAAAIIASGFSETERVRKAQELGAGPYVKKPYTIDKIGQVVKAALAG